MTPDDRIANQKCRRNSHTTAFATTLDLFFDIMDEKKLRVCTFKLLSISVTPSDKFKKIALWWPQITFQTSKKRMNCLTVAFCITPPLPSDLIGK